MTLVSEVVPGSRSQVAEPGPRSMARMKRSTFHEAWAVLDHWGKSSQPRRVTRGTFASMSSASVRL